MAIRKFCDRALPDTASGCPQHLVKYVGSILEELCEGQLIQGLAIEGNTEKFYPSEPTEEHLPERPE